MNRRKAMIGWAVYSVGKPVVMQVAKRKVKGKAKGVVRTKGWKSRLPKAAGVVAAVGAVIGALAFWRTRSSDDDDVSES